MNTIAEVSVQPTNDPNIKAYHTRYEMSSSPEDGWRGSPGELGGFGLLILDIRGVTRVHVTPYVMLVTKAQLFDWGEISCKVEEILKEFAVSQRLLKDDQVGSVDRDEEPRTVKPKVRAKAPSAGSTRKD